MTYSEEAEREMGEYETDFRQYRRSVLDEFEHKITEEARNRAESHEVGVRIVQQMREVAAERGFEWELFDELERDEADRMDEYVDSRRAELVDREPHFDKRLRRRADEVLSHVQSGASRAYLLGADVVALDQEWLESYDGERGNPATWLYDANKRWEGKASLKGTGPGCSGGTSYHPVGTIWYYTWLPPEPGTYYVMSLTGYHGWYGVYVQTFPFYVPCAKAGVNATVELRVGEKRPGHSNPMVINHQIRSIIDKFGSSLIEMGPLDGTARNYFQVTYHGSGPLFFNVVLSLRVRASGQLSYAELNFKDGDANYVEPPYVLVSGPQ